MGCCGDGSKDKVRTFDTNEFESVPNSDPIYGEPLKYDISFKGPLNNRSCTDILCLLIFIVFLGAWAAIAFYATTNGDLNKLLVPTDTHNRKCGIDSNVLDKPYLFFFNLEKCVSPLTPITGCPTPQVCVKQCPEKLFIFKDDLAGQMNIEELKKNLICQTQDDLDKIKSFSDAKVAVEAERCARWYVKSKNFANRCVPNDNNDLQFLIDHHNIPNEIKWVVEKLQIGDVNLFGQKVVEDIVNSWVTILIALIIVMVVALIYIALMRWLAAPVIWLSILGVLIGIGVGIYFCIKEYLYYKENPGVGRHDKNIKATLQTWFEDPTAWMILTIILAVLFLIILLLVIFLRKRIVIAIALVKEGSKAVSTVISSVFFPIFPWALQVLAIGFAIAVGLYLASIGESSFKVVGELGTGCVCEGAAQSYAKGNVCNPDIFNSNCYNTTKTSPSIRNFFRNSKIPCTETGCYFERISNPSHITYMHIYNVVGFLWLAFFISAFGEMVLAATFATWYWTFHKSDVPYFTLTKAFSRTIRYHIGTLAFGALVLTICRIIRLILEYIDAKLKKFDNAFTRAILCCMKCFFWCLESFLRFMNRNAYIMCAIHGKNFCSSAKDAFNLLMRNFLRVVALDKVTDFLFFLSKLLLMIAAGFATYYYVEFAFINDDKLHYIGVPTTIVVLGTYLIATVFFSVYSMAVDTLFLCFLEDCERNDGSEEKPYYMSKQLMKILRKHNQLPRHHYN